jgi:hypothetical protein
MQQATVNLLADTGIQPGTVQSGLAIATASAHSTPISQITFPAHSGSPSTGSAVTVTEKAANSSGEVVDVEVSTNGGATRDRSPGRRELELRLDCGSPGSARTESRAVMTVEPLETLSARRTVTIGTWTCPCGIWGDALDSPPPANAEMNGTFVMTILPSQAGRSTSGSSRITDSNHVTPVYKFIIQAAGKLP